MTNTVYKLSFIKYICLHFAICILQTVVDKMQKSARALAYMIFF